MRLPIFIFFILLSITGFSQISRKEYIQRYQLLAIEEMKRSGIPASIIMAQACLESADGNSELSKKSNNHFGIKCKKGWKGKKVYYDDDARHECFRKYKTVEDSYIDHTNFLLNNPRYASLFNHDRTNYKAWAHGLKKAGYATARDYAHRLIKIIEENKLYRLDMNINYNELITLEDKDLKNDNISNSLTINSFTTHKVTKRNRIKSVVAHSGDTYETIAQELGLDSWVLYKYNDQPAGYIPRNNEVVYIQSKKRKTPKDILTHRVEKGETMHYISQLYGVKLKSLYHLNRMKKGEQPKPGQIIYLHKRSRR